MNNQVFKILEEIRKEFVKSLIDEEGNLTPLGWYCVLRGISEEIKLEGKNK